VTTCRPRESTTSISLSPTSSARLSDELLAPLGWTTRVRNASYRGTTVVVRDLQGFLALNREFDPAALCVAPANAKHRREMLVDPLERELGRAP
jgi:hypothetical protein